MKKDIQCTECSIFVSKIYKCAKCEINLCSKCIYNYNSVFLCNGCYTDIISEKEIEVYIYESNVN